MPSSSKFSFVLEIDGSNASADAKKWAAELEQHLKGMSLDVPGFEIKGLGQAKKDLEAISRLAGSVGKALFKDADKQVDALDDRLAAVQQKLSGIISTNQQASWTEKFASDVEQAATASGKMVTTLARWKQEMEKADNEVRTIQQNVNNLSQQRLFPAESGLKLTVGEYVKIADLVQKYNERKAQGKTLSQEELKILQQYENTMSSVVSLAESQDIEKGKATSSWGPAAKQMQEMVLQYRKLRDEQTRVEAESRQATKKLADAMSSKDLVLPKEASGSLADMTRALQILAKAGKDAADAISSQTRRLSTYKTRLEEVAKALERVHKAQQGVFDDTPAIGAGLGPVSGTATGSNLAPQAEAASAQTQGVFERMRSSIRVLLQRLRQDQVGTFEPLIEDAERAHEGVVGGSPIPDLVRDVLHWLRILRNGEEDVFVPLIKGAQYTQEQVEKAFKQMRFPAGAMFGGKNVGGQFATKDALTKFFSVTGLPPTSGPGSVAGYIDEQEQFFQREIGDYQRALDKAEQVTKERDKLFQRLGTTEAEWAGKGRLDKFATAIQAAQSNAWGIRGFGSQLTGMGRGMTMAAGAVTGGATLAAREYLALNEPLERAARNLELNRALTDELDASLRQMAGTVSALPADEQADMLYKWAAATGAQIDSSVELDRMLAESLNLQKLVKLGMVDAAQAVEIVTDVQSQYGKSVTDTEDIVAKLLAVSARSKAEIGDLGSAFSMVGAMADQSNVSFEETAATLNILAAYGQRGSRAGSGLSRMMENLIAPAEGVQEQLDKVLGAGALESAEGKFIGIAAAVELIAEKTATWSEFQRQQFLSQTTTAAATRMLLPLIDMQIKARDRGINAIRAEQKILEGRVDAEVQAYIKMRQETDGYTISTKSALDTLDGYWSQYTESLTGQADMAKARWAAMVDTIGKQVVTTALPSVEKLLEGVSRLVDAAGDNPDLVKAALGGTAVVAGVGALVTAMGKGISLYADVRMISAAASSLAAANKTVAAASQQVIAANLMLKAASMQSGGNIIDAGTDLTGTAGAAGRTGIAARLAPLAAPIMALVAALTGATVLINLAAEGAEEQALHRQERSGYTKEQFDYLTTKGGLTDDPRTSGLVWDGTKQKATAGEIEMILQRAGLSAQVLESSMLGLGGIWDQLAGMNLAGPVEQAARSASTVTKEGHAAVQVWREFVTQITTAQGEMRDLAGWGAAVRDSVLQMHDVLGEAELGEILKSETASQWQNLTGLAGMMDPKAIGAWGDQYRTELASYLQGLNNTQQWFVDLAVADFNAGWDTRVQKVKDSSKEIEQAQKDSKARLEQVWGEWEGVVGGLMQPTQVTSEDMAATEAGSYRDKWDEYVRQLRAAQTDMQSEFRKMIPTNVEQQGQGAINTWVEQQIRGFYAGLAPDKVNWQALMDEYDRVVSEKIGKQNLLDTLMQKLMESGRTPDEYAAKTALGLESPIKAMWFGGQSPEEIGQAIQLDMSKVAAGVSFTPEMSKVSSGTFAASMFSGMSKSLGEQPWGATLVQTYSTSINNSIGDIKDLGGTIGGFIFDGMREEMSKYSIIDTIAQVVLEELLAYGGAQ